MAKTDAATNQTIEGEAKVEQTTAQEQPKAPGLELQDLGMMLNLLNTAIKRGAFEPNELTTVGNTYTKLEAFLQYQAQLQMALRASQKGEA